MWNNSGVTRENCVRMDFPINRFSKQKQNIIRIVGIPRQIFATQRI